MSDIPELMGSSALWAFARTLELGVEKIFAFDSSDTWMFFAGIASAFALAGLRAMRARRDALTSSGIAAPAVDRAFVSPYRMLCALIPDVDLREARIAEVMASGGLTRIAAINRLVEASAVPKRPAGGAPLRTAPQPMRPPPDPAEPEFAHDGSTPANGAS